MSGTRAKDWYASSAEFLQLCGDAQSLAKHEGEQEFAGEMMAKANQYGLETFISAKQLTWLCRLADHVEPKRSEPKPHGSTHQQEQSKAAAEAEAANPELYGVQPVLGPKHGKDFDDDLPPF